MKAFAPGLVAVLSAVGIAQAQSGSADRAYCQALSDRYTRYVGTSEFSTSQPADRRTDPEARLALSQCHHGDARSAIPVLERRLINARVALPAR